MQSGGVQALILILPGYPLMIFKNLNKKGWKTLLREKHCYIAPPPPPGFHIAGFLNGKATKGKTALQRRVRRKTRIYGQRIKHNMKNTQDLE